MLRIAWLAWRDSMGRCVATNVPNGEKRASFMYIYPGRQAGWLMRVGGKKTKTIQADLGWELFPFIHMTFYIASSLSAVNHFFIFLLVKAYNLHTFIYTILVFCGSTATNRPSLIHFPTHFTNPDRFFSFFFFISYQDKYDCKFRLYSSVLSISLRLLSYIYTCIHS